MKKNLMKIAAVAFAVFGLTQLTGCASTATKMIDKSDLSVETKMDTTVFLEPMGRDNRTVFLDVRNSSDKDIDVNGMMAKMSQILATKGYTMVNNPDDAAVVIQENILSVAQISEDAAKNALAAAGEGAALGALAGAATHSGSYSGYGSRSAGFALAGAAINFAGNLLVKDVYYNIVTDIRVRQTSATEASGYKEFKTRTVTVANKVNLDFAEAKPALVNGLVKTTTGIF